MTRIAKDTAKARRNIWHFLITGNFCVTKVSEAEAAMMKAGGGGCGEGCRHGHHHGAGAQAGRDKKKELEYDIEEAKK